MTRNAVRRVLPRRLPSPAMIVACIALTVALGGTSYAAIRLPASSVGTVHLKKGAVTGAKVRKNTLTGTQIRESTLSKVPSALNADSADSADSADISRVDYRQSAPTPIPATGVAVRATATGWRRKGLQSQRRSRPRLEPVRQERLGGERRRRCGRDYADGLRHLRRCRSLDTVKPKRARLATGGLVIPTRWCWAASTRCRGRLD